MQIAINVSDELYEGIKRRDGSLETEYVCDELMKAVDNGIPLPENHGKIVDLGNIDKDRIEQDNPVITININGTAIEAVSLDYLDSLPDLTKKEE